MSRRRILVLTKTTALGGAERLLINTLPHLDHGAFDYRFAALDAGGPLEQACREAKLPFERLPHPHALDPRNAIQLRRRLRAEGIELVHAHLPLPAALARAATRGLATRLVYTEHNVQGAYRAPSRWLNAATYGWQHRVVSVSREVESSALRRMGAAARERSAVVPNGVDFERIEREAAARPATPLPPTRRGAFRVLVPASLNPRKGHDVLLDALERLADAPFPPLAVWLAGDGPLRQELEQRVRSAGLGPIVSFLGTRADLFSVMARVEAVVLPSHHEGHPLALLEALALGRASLATAVGGVPEILAPEQTGLLVPPGDPAALAGALARLRDDPRLCRRLGVNAARDARRRFDVRRSVAAIESIYQHCLALPGGLPPASARWRSRPMPRSRSI